MTPSLPASGTAGRTASRPATLAALALAVLLSSCEDSDAIAPDPQPPLDASGARRLELEGQVFRLGSSDPEAAPEETPGWTRFPNDVWMDTRETSQAEFASLMGRNPSTDTGARLPVTDVTWYDAVLYANARSRKDGLDSVYEHAGVRRDASGAVVGLEAFVANLDRGGWRLPTEAEWEAAARGGGTGAYAWGERGDSLEALNRSWFARNSGGRPHEVGTKPANAWGFHDLAGNVMEWVHDWKGSFPSDTIEGFSGSEAPGDVPEVPVKGGSFRHGAGLLRPSSRTGTYPAYRSSKTEYVGFRLARGGFPARTLAVSGEPVDAPPVSLARKDVASILGASEARLVFLNRSGGKGTLSWIDFGEGNPVVRTLPHRDAAFHPSISPDGRWVAWSTGLEGSTAPSRLLARRLAPGDTTVLELGEGAIPRWWTDGIDTFLVRTGAMDNTAPGWSSLPTSARRWSSGTLVGPEIDWARGGYHDGRSGSFLFGGYRRLERLDIRTAKRSTLFVRPWNGKTSEDTSQVCNASAAPDPSGRVLFLDFGYAGTSTVVGRPYGIHEVAFVADSTGSVVKTLAAPVTERQWEHLEWSNHPRWAVSGAISHTGSQANLYVLDLDSGRSTRIASGRDLWHPALWVGAAGAGVVAGDAHPDSSGAYNTPETDYAQEEFAIKARAWWLVKDRIEIVAMGSSRVKAGILPEGFGPGKAFNFGVSGGEPVMDRRILEDYVLPHAPRVKVVVLSLMPGWLFQYRGQLVWDRVKVSDGVRYDRSHGFWASGLPEGFLEHVRRRNWATSRFFDTLGGTVISRGKWGTVAEYAAPPVEDVRSAEFESNWADLEAMVDSCAARGIHLVLVNFPQAPVYATSPVMGKYGPTWASWRTIRTRLRAMEAAKPLMHFYDANLDGGHDYPDSAAINADHLSVVGARILTSRLDSVLTSILANSP